MDKDVQEMAADKLLEEAHIQAKLQDKVVKDQVEEVNEAVNNAQLEKQHKRTKTVL